MFWSCGVIFLIISGGGYCDTRKCVRKFLESIFMIDMWDLGHLCSFSSCLNLSIWFGFFVLEFVLVLGDDGCKRFVLSMPCW